MGLLDGFNDLLFPDEFVCHFCGEKIDNKAKYHLCPLCTDRLLFLNKVLSVDIPYIDSAAYSLFYSEYTREKVYHYKYYNGSYLYETFGEILWNTIMERELLDNIDIITYVPIHKKRKAKRGYDQSELLAEYISRKGNVPLSKGNLIRHRYTKPQNKLQRSERIKNIIDAFSVKKPNIFYGKEILLIDDIITTGGTISECGKVLVDSGAIGVHALAITSSMKG